jgi:hypothetical protein
MMMISQTGLRGRNVAKKILQGYDLESGTVTLLLQNFFPGYEDFLPAQSD